MAEKNTAGRLRKIIRLELILLCSRGKSRVNRRNVDGINADVAKLILPQNKIEVGCFKTYSIKMLNPQAAADQEKTEKVKFTRL